MNVLLVDDQKEIVENIRNGVRWEELLVEQVYTAVSALEAKLILVNFQVDLLITDIEMPGESGIRLAEWTREKYEDVEIVFLTAYSKFDYAKSAVTLRIFDYILQPVNYAEIEAVIRRVQEEWKKKEQVRILRRQADVVKEQQNAIFDSLLMKCRSDRQEDAESLWGELIRHDGEGRDIYVILVHIRHWLKLKQQWPDALMRFTFANVMTELLTECGCEVRVGSTEPGKYWIFLFAKKGILTEEQVEKKNRIFFAFLKKHLDSRISMYADHKPVGGHIVTVIGQLTDRSARHADGECGIFYQDEDSGEARGADVTERLMAWIHENVWKRGGNVTRADAAEYVSMNQEYMSRMFKEKTGISFKDYVLQEKMKYAEKLLRETAMPVSVIASKVGFSNFSHFSAMFKRFYRDAPADYRKKMS